MNWSGEPPIDPRIVAAWNAAHPDNPSLRLQTLLIARVGSHSHNTYLPPTEPGAIDDVDYVFVVAPPMRKVCGLSARFETWVYRFEELDVVVHSLDKFCRLLLKQNPNVLSLLWMPGGEIPAGGPTSRSLHNPANPSDHYPFMHADTYPLFALRERLLSKEVARTFAGYGIAQIEGIKKGAFAGYMGDKRRALVERFGFDCKSAAHAVRLFATGRDTLRYGSMSVWRPEPEAEYLRSIKKGHVPLEDIMALTEQYRAELADAERESPLPDRLSDETVATLEQIVMDIYQSRW